MGLLLWYIHYLNPEFYTTIFRLSTKGDMVGLADYISSFGYLSAAITILLLALSNVTGIPTIPFLTVAGIILDSFLPLLFPGWENLSVVYSALLLHVSFSVRMLKKLLKK